MMPTMRVDKGAISFVMNGANIMCQGFTSKGGRIETPLDAGAPVVSEWWSPLKRSVVHILMGGQGVMRRYSPKCSVSSVFPCFT